MDDAEVCRPGLKMLRVGFLSELKKRKTRNAVNCCKISVKRIAVVRVRVDIKERKIDKPVRRPL